MLYERGCNVSCDSGSLFYLRYIHMGFFSVLVFMFMRILRQDFSSCLTLIDFRWMTEAIMLVGKWVFWSWYMWDFSWVSFFLICFFSFLMVFSRDCYFLWWMFVKMNLLVSYSHDSFMFCFVIWVIFGGTWESWCFLLDEHLLS